MSIKKIVIKARTRDCFHATLIDESGNDVHEEHGYVPTWMPGRHYGDAFELVVDNETGQILNWVPIKESDILKEEF